MSIALLFWILMLFWFLFGLYTWRTPPAPGQPWWQPAGGDLILFLLLFVIGWRVFGWPIHG